MSRQGAAHARYEMLEDDGIRDFMVLCDAAYPPDAVELPVVRQRKLYNDLCTKFSPPRPPGIAVSEKTIPGPGGGISLRIYRPDVEPDPPVLIYLHGGGFILGGLDSHDSICAEIAAQAGVGVVAVDYRLAPEHRFPAAFEDCCSVLADIGSVAHQTGLDATRLLVGGDSAGGNLAAAVCLHARDHGTSTISGQVLVYPALGGDMTLQSYVDLAEAPGLTTADVNYYHDMYYGPVGSPGHSSKFAGPLRETDYRNLPPAFIVAAGWDPLRDDAFTYAERLRLAGVSAELRQEPLLVHAFLRARHMSKPAANSFAAIVAATHSLAHHGRQPSQPHRTKSLP